MFPEFTPDEEIGLGDKESNEMSLPGFSAEASVYQTSRSYRSRGSTPGLTSRVEPATVYGCSGSDCHELTGWEAVAVGAFIGGSAGAAKTPLGALIGGAIGAVGGALFCLFDSDCHF